MKHVYDVVTDTVDGIPWEEWHKLFTLAQFNSRFVPGDSCIYHGPSQGMILAPGDAVEVTEDLNPGYRIKLSTPYANAIYTCADSELSYFLPYAHKPLAHTTSRGYSNSDQAVHRKEQGLCTQCGTKLAMSSLGLLPCSLCPPPLAKW